jgi:ribosome-associated toxin RatA of RatAB toxin-antitoxin module
MIHTENHVIIRAPIDQVYAVAEDKARFPDFMPHMIECVEGRDGTRIRFRMAARMKFGIVSRWISERVAFETNRYAAYRTEGFCRHMEGRWTFEALEPGSDGSPMTRVTLTHDFDVGHPILSLVIPLENIVSSCVRDNSQRMLDAIHKRVESATTNILEDVLHA